MQTPDTEEPRYGEHDSAEAVIRHLASVDHDNGEPELRNTAQRLLDLGRADPIVHAAAWDMGHAAACQLYRDEVRRLRGVL